MKNNYRILAISRASFERVNRAVYRELSHVKGVELSLVIPASIQTGENSHAIIDLEEDFPVAPLTPQGENLRLQRLLGLKEVIASFRPTHVIVEWDPASMVVRDVLALGKGGRFETWVLTCENRSNISAKDVLKSISSGKPREMARTAVVWALMRYAASRVKRVFTINEAGTEIMRDLGFRKVTRIPLGYDTGLFKVQPEKKILSTKKRLGIKGPCFGYFGRISPEKGLDVLIEALSQMTNRKWQLLIDRFHLYGSEYAREIQVKLKDLPWAERIVLFDAKHEEIPDYMNAVDFVVLPSRKTNGQVEQYGRVLPEAMACGKIVLGTTCGAIPEIVGDAGFLVAENDVKALHLGLTNVLNLTPKEREKIQKRALDRAKRELSVQRQVEIWKECLAA